MLRMWTPSGARSAISALTSMVRMSFITSCVAPCQGSQDRWTHPGRGLQRVLRDAGVSSEGGRFCGLYRLQFNHGVERPASRFHGPKDVRHEGVPCGGRVQGPTRSATTDATYVRQRWACVCRLVALHLQRTHRCIGHPTEHEGGKSGAGANDNHCKKPAWELSVLTTSNGCGRPEIIYPGFSRLPTFVVDIYIYIGDRGRSAWVRRHFVARGLTPGQQRMYLAADPIVRFNSPAEAAAYIAKHKK